MAAVELAELPFRLDADLEAVRPSEGLVGNDPFERLSEVVPQVVDRF